MTTYNIILTAALLGYHITSREAEEIQHLFTGENLADAIRDYCAAYES